MPPRVLEPITVGDLVSHLLTLPQHLLVAYRCCSENVLLEISDLELEECQPPRPDGWVGDARPDRERQTYLLFPGN